MTHIQNAKEIAESVVKYFLENWGTESQKEVATFAINAWLSHPDNQSLLAGEDWISVKDRLPDYKKNDDCSENVLVICDGKLAVMARCYDPGAEGWLWGNCYGNIFSDEAETDDDYKITHWQPLPEPPKITLNHGKIN